MDYFTVSGGILRTGYKDKKYWYILVIKELLDNAVDFLWKYYQGYNDTSLTVYVTKDDSLLHIKMRNSNSQNVRVFEHPELIFDPVMRYGSKQDIRIISRGMLGDALKQVLALGYVLIHSGDDGTAFSNEQWNNPLIVRCNGKETHVRIIVDQSSQTHRLDIKEVKLVGHTDTEIEISLPMIADLDIHDIERFCQLYPLFTTDISFKFRLVDNSSDKPGAVQVEEVPITNGKVEEKIVQSISARPRKAAINIEYPVLHSISSKWNNIWTIHTLMPAEFITMITNVYDKESVTIYERLQSGREGNNMKKTDENKMSIAEFLSDPDHYEKLEKLFWDLKAALGGHAPKELSLPYSDNKERKEALVSRVCSLYPLLDPNKAVYKVVRGFFTDNKEKQVFDADGNYRYENGKGILEYPLALEFLVIPYTSDCLNPDDFGNQNNKPSEFIGSVNYSLSPKGNEFEGDYEWKDKKDYRVSADSMKDILKTYNFNFYEFAGPKEKIPSIILVNLISQRVDYHGHDKSRIDTHAFTETIIQASKEDS